MRVPDQQELKTSGEKSTTEILFEHYHTFSRRLTIENEKTRRDVYESFRRILSPLLPDNLSARILDIGCGEGSLLAFLTADGYKNLHDFDISTENVAICHRLGFTFVQEGSALDLSELIENNQFDLVFAMDLLEHIPKEKAAGFLKQVYASLKDGGCVIVQTPNMGCIYAQYHRYNDLSHEFGVQEKSARDLFMVAGFVDRDIQIVPAWNATTFLGFVRETYLRILHRLIYLSANTGGCPRIPTINILIRARKA